MDYLEKGLKSSELLDSTFQMSSAAHRAHAGPRRSPESSPSSPGGSSSASDHRASCLSAAALSRAVSVACCTAVAFLVALAAFLVLPLQAQAQTTYVSNIGQSENESSLGISSFDQGQGFTTGTDSAGYVLASVDIKLESSKNSESTGSQIPTVTIVQGRRRAQWWRR